MVYAYARVSTDEQGRSGLGLEAQRDAILRRFPDADIREEVGSGGRADNRPVLQKLLQELLRGDVLVAAKLDRLTRSTRDWPQLVERALKQGWKLVVLDADIDTREPAGELMANMLASFAQFERRMISARSSAAWRIKQNRGDAGTIPRDVVAEILRMRHEVLPPLSCNDIARELNRRGTPSLGRMWHATTIRNVLRQEARAAA